MTAVAEYKKCWPVGATGMNLCLELDPVNNPSLRHMVQARSNVKSLLNDLPPSVPHNVFSDYRYAIRKQEILRKKRTEAKLLTAIKAGREHLNFPKLKQKVFIQKRPFDSISYSMGGFGRFN